MPLLNLPSEILRMVVIQVSKRRGLRALFPIRATSRVLRDEVNQVLFFESPVAAFKKSRCIGAIDGHTAEFLFNKLHKPLDAERELPALVHKMTIFLCKSLDITEEDERSCERRLCIGLVRYFGASFTRGLLLWEHRVKHAKLPARDSSELMDRYKILAAMLFGASDLVDGLWGSLLRDGALFNHEDCTTPLVHAVSTQDTALFNSIIKYCRTNPADTASSAFEMQKAFGLALQNSRADFAGDIASISAPRIQKVFMFRLWLARAIPLRNMALFELILRQHPGHVQSRHLDIALTLGTFEMVTALLGVNKITKVNDTQHSARRGERFIEIACSAGNTEVIQGLIDANVKVPDTALSLALKYDKGEAFIHLRHLGCPLPSMALWPRTCSREMYDDLCAMKVNDGIEE